jgi:uncharacterized protein with HEPN domain
MAIIWEIVRDKLPELCKAVRELLDELKSANDPE